MSWGAIAVAAGTAIAGAASAEGAEDAASASAKSSERAARMQMQQYQQTRQDLQPWMTTGNYANQVLARTYGLTGQKPSYDDFFESPDYQFRLAEGNKSLDRSAAGRGMLLSGAQLKGLTRYNQNMASTEFGNWFNRLNALSTQGQNSAAGVGAAGATAAANAGNAIQNAGNARASGYQDQANAYSNAIGGLARVGGNYLGSRNLGNGNSGYGYTMLNDGLPEGMTYDLGQGSGY